MAEAAKGLYTLEMTYGIEPKKREPTICPNAIMILDDELADREIWLMI